MRLRFDAPAGSGHRLEDRGLLESGTWNGLVEFTGAETNRVEDFVVPATNTLRFFRLLRY